MALTKCRIGDHIELRGEINSNLTYGIDDVRGVNNLKFLMPTKADLNGRDLSKFQIVYPGEFVFNHRTSRNGNKFSIAFNDGEKPVICTEDYVVFRIKEESQKILSAVWLYMYFNRSEFDRYVITNSWGSSTEFYNWADICAVELSLPTYAIQQKYVDIYKAVVANQCSYESKIEEIKRACDAFYDRNKHRNLRDISELVEVNNKKNTGFCYGIDSLRGISDKCRFSKTTASVSERDIDKYLIIEDGEFAVNFMCLGNWGKFYLAYNDSGESYVVSPACSTLRIKSKITLNPYYFLYILQRDEFQRRCVFVGDGNTRGGINTTDFGGIKIPLLEVSEQRIIADLFQAYDKRKDINERLKALIKDICPILIRGSLEEGK